MSETQVSQRVAVRLGRQAILTRKIPQPPKLDVVVHENVLRRRFGTPDQMVEQFNKINEIGSLRNVVVRVLPMDAGIHRGVQAGGNFAVLDFSPNGRGSEPSVAYSDGMTGALYLDKAPEVAMHNEVWASIWEASFDETESRRLIASIAREVRS